MPIFPDVKNNNNIMVLVDNLSELIKLLLIMKTTDFFLTSKIILRQVNGKNDIEILKYS